MTMRFIPALALLLMCWGLLGCGQPLQEPGTDTSGSGGTATSGNAKGVTVTMTEWTVSVEPASVPAGNAAITLKNAGKLTHGLYVSGPGVDAKGELVQPGGSSTVTVALTEGELTLFDFVGNNETEHRMTAVLGVK